MVKVAQLNEQSNTFYVCSMLAKTKLGFFLKKYYTTAIFCDIIMSDMFTIQRLKEIEHFDLNFAQLISTTEHNSPLYYLAGLHLLSGRSKIKFQITFLLLNYPGSCETP